jgi:hypothetical protein
MTTPWQDMRELRWVDLEDSWVLGWSLNPAGTQLRFTLEASLWPGHPSYSQPKPGEYTCYRPATLYFEQVVELTGLLPQEKASSTVDPGGTRDYGNIEGLVEAGGAYSFSGSMGDVHLLSKRLRLVIEGP